jgi:NTE family protein
MEHVNPEIAESVIVTQPGQPIEQAELDRDMRRIFGTGDFEHVSYSLIEEPGKRILNVDAVEKAWGPNYLRLGLGLSTDFHGDAYYNLLGSYRMTWLNRLGAEWRTDAQIGRTSRLYTEFYQPVEPSQTFFVVPSTEYQRRTVDVFSGKQRIASYELDSPDFAFDVGAQFTKYGQLRLGYQRRFDKISLDTGTPAFTPVPDRAVFAGIRVQAAVDQLDNVNFPRSGYAASLHVFDARTALGSNVDFTRADLDLTYALSLGENTISLGGKFGGKVGSEQLPSLELFQWGGFLQQSGYPTGALIGGNIAFGRLVYYRRFIHTTYLDGAYGGFSLELGKVGAPLVPGNEQGRLKSASIWVGFDTPIGPFYVAYGHTGNGYGTAYVFLGRP